MRKSFTKLLISVSVLLLVFLSLQPVHSQNDLSFEFVKQVKTQHEDSLFQRGDVYAVGIGKEGDRFVIDVYADRAAEPYLPTQIEGITIRFNESGPFYAASTAVDGNHKATFSPPIPIGVSTSNTSANTTATIGFRVVRQAIPPAGPEVAGTFGYITANHVAAGPCWNQKPIGEDQFQAGKADDPNGNKIGDLEDFVFVIKGSFTLNEVDAAFVKTSSSSTIGTQICDIGPRTTTPVEVLPGAPVFKSGRSTEVTKGEVVNVSFTTRVTLPCGTARFINQISVKPTCSANPTFTEFGDSGAPVVDLGNNPVAIVISNNIAPCSSARTTVTPIQPILDAFGVDLY